MQIRKAVIPAAGLGTRFAYRIEGTSHDDGKKFGFLKATVELALKRADLGNDFRDYLKSLDL